MGEALTNGVNNKRRADDKSNENKIKKIKYDPNELFEEDEIVGLARDGFLVYVCLNATRLDHPCVVAYCISCYGILAGGRSSWRAKTELKCRCCNMNVVECQNEAYFRESYRKKHAEKVGRMEGEFCLPLKCERCGLAIVVDRKKVILSKRGA